MDAVDSETWAIFQDDLTEAITSVESSLLGLEGDPSDTRERDLLFRALHNIKGSAGLVGLKPLARLVHAAEDVISAVARGVVPFDGNVLNAMLAVVDLVRNVAIEASEGLAPETEASLDELCAQLGQMHPRQDDTVSISSLKANLHTLGELLAGLSQGRADAESTELETQLQRALAQAERLSLDKCTGDLEAIARYAEARRWQLVQLYWRLSLVSMSLPKGGAVLFDEQSGLSSAAISVYVGWMTSQLRDLASARGEDAEQAQQARLSDLEASLDALDADSRALLEPPLGRLSIALATSPTSLAAAVQSVVEVGAQLEHQSLPEPGADSPKPEAPAHNEAPSECSASPTPRPRRRKNKARPNERAGESKFLRVEATRVEHLMALAGELGLAAGAVFRHPDFATVDIEGLRSGIERVEGLIRELQDTSSSLALVPIGTLFPRLDRLAHDLRQATGKQFTLRTLGGDTEIDKTLVDALVEPLIHLIRNAVDHGVESPEARARAKKDEVATITLVARHNGDDITIEVRDDGGGMQRDNIIERAIERGMLDPERAPTLDDVDVWNLVFAPGFSTTTSVSGISGRGVGMDVVKEAIQSLRGRIEVRSESGVGTTILLHVPLTLAFLDGMVVRVGESLYVIPVNSIVKVFRVEQDDVVAVEADGVDLVRVGTELVPAPTLASLYTGAPPDASLLRSLVVVVSASRGKLALPIDELLGQEQVTLKPLSGALTGIRGAAACGLLRSGEVALALSCDGLHDLMAS